MSYLEIILPFGIPNQALAKELLRQAKAPSLAKLLSFGKLRQQHQLNEFARQLPHEFCLYQDPFSVSNSNERSFPNLDKDERLSSPATTHHSMSLKGVTPNAGFWFTLSPVHIHIARDHLVMTDPQRLQISEVESRELFRIAQETCNEFGHELVYGDVKTWFLRADDWSELRTSSLSAAAGHNMDIWIAEGEMARPWRKLQNEIQMAWHISSVNQQREENAKSPINSVWLHSGSAQIKIPNFQFGVQALQHFLSDANLTSRPQRILIEDLNEPALNSDWGTWLAQLNQLETTCFNPLWTAINQGQLKNVKLVLTDTQQLALVECRPARFWQRWKTATLSPLLSLVQTNN